MSNESVIDNENIILLDQLKNILPDTNRASIAVGYFFISGFAKIMNHFTKIESSKDPNHIIRLLISPITNRPTAEALLAQNESLDYVQRKVSTSNIDGRKITANQVKDTLGYMPQSIEEQNAVIKLADLIKRKKLQVRVYTKEKLHAKAYIFELENQQLPKMSIVGSSNLSISGISENTELNLRTNHNDDSEKLLEWFDRHWAESEEFTQEIAEIIDNSWIKQRKPIEVYQKAILNEYGKLEEIDVTTEQESEKLFDFQKIAVANAVSKLNEYGGVIIADVVGTGKSFIGSMLLKYLKEKNRSKPLIICPPHLIDMWKDYMRKFDIHAEILSRYKIATDENILNKYTNCDAVLIDESHNFRNKTKAYDALYSFMEQQPDDSFVIMLTATPISNSVNDLKNQLKLFPADRISNVPPLGNTSLDEYFKGVEQDFQLTIPGQDKIRELLRHILIRRTRKQIQDNFAKKENNRYYLESSQGKKYFPKRSLDNPREYDIDKVYLNSFEQTQEYVNQLRLARYSPGAYLKEEYQNTTHPQYKKYRDLDAHMASLVGLVRTGLLKRMESSVAAFHSSVRNYAEGSEKFMEFLSKGIVPIGKDYQDAIYKHITDDGDYIEELGVSNYDIDAFDVMEWKADLNHDINMFDNILRMIPDIDDFTKHDDKLHTLLGILENQKILLFTESRVTAKYVYDYLKLSLPDKKIAQIDSLKSSKEKNDIVCKFDPDNNNVTVPPEEQLDILVSTDVLSEGVNLQAGKTIINYDFHWNPVRLIQRVGRIDRIGSKHDIINVVNFLPTTKVESQLKLKERVANKIETIRKIIGHDQKILEETEKIDKDAVIDIYTGNESILDEADGILDVIQTVAELDADKIRNDDTLLEKIELLPLGIHSAVGNNSLLVACEADERILDGETIISKKTFRRYYKITDDVITKLHASSFLRLVGENIEKPSICDDHHGIIRIAWKQFEREMKNESVRTQSRKLRTYFERKLIALAEDDTTSYRAKKLIPLIKKMMVSNRQPYRSLVELRKRIDKDKLDDDSILSKLEKIFEKSYNYRKEIGKPRILYSMRIN